MLEVAAIDLHYGAAQALRAVSLSARLGEVTCVLGRNGVGKTSLLRALVGAVLGAVLVNYAKTYFTSGLLAPYWLFMLGALFIAVTLFLPRGVVGSFRHWLARERAGKPMVEAPLAHAPPRPAE